VSDFYRVTIDAPYWTNPELSAEWGQPHGVFQAGSMVELLDGGYRARRGIMADPEAFAWVTDGVLTGWVHRHLLEAVPSRPTPPRTALERLTGPDDL
jgi:hypothetical protein